MTANDWADEWHRRFPGTRGETAAPEAREQRRAAWNEGRLLALERMVLGVMEATAIGYAARMPDPLPSLALMAASPEAKHHFRLDGMYGGFSLELHDASSAEPYVLAECWSRVVGGSQLLRRITVKSVEIVSQGLF